jgi:hypothetical protein
MSSLVQAKCTNSLAAFRSSGRASNLDLIQYSTALTSWLVVFLDLLDGHGIGFGEILDQTQQVSARSWTQRLEFGEARIAQADEPGDFNLHAAVHVALFAHQRAQGQVWPA